MVKIDPKTETGMVRPSRQVLLGTALLIIGVAIVIVTLLAGIPVVPGVGGVIAVWGIVLILNAILGRRVAAWPWGGRAQRGTGESDEPKIIR